MPSKTTKQATFNKVVAHLRKQGVQAINDDGQCLYRYRLPDGEVLKCAAGRLIPKKFYRVGMEGQAIESRVISRVLRARGHDLTLVSNLQHVHDHCWSYREARLRQVALSHGLVYTPPSAGETEHAK
jgi:hypothetical protein